MNSRYVGTSIVASSACETIQPASRNICPADSGPASANSKTGPVRFGLVPARRGRNPVVSPGATALQAQRHLVVTADDFGIGPATSHGILDLASYGQLRDALFKCALEIPRAVIVDLSELLVPTDATLAVFPSVWMLTNSRSSCRFELLLNCPKPRSTTNKNATCL